MKIKKFKNIISLRFIAILFITVVAILTAGFAYKFFVLQPQKDIEQAQVEKARLESLNKQEFDKKLEDCLEKAKNKARDLFQLNSYESPQEGFPDARRWDSAEIRDSIDKQYNEEREFCIKLYK